jgi:hypothetical protein
MKQSKERPAQNVPKKVKLDGYKIYARLNN